MALYNIAQNRPQPIPVFAEMSSVNPLVVMPQALAFVVHKLHKIRWHHLTWAVVSSVPNQV
jgi:hypothetical protein